jgi:hypothetical protein
VGVVAGLLITRWWLALLVPIAAGLLADAIYPDDPEFPISWAAALLVLLGLAGGSLTRFFADELSRKRDGSRPR